MKIEKKPLLIRAVYHVGSRKPSFWEIIDQKNGVYITQKSSRAEAESLCKENGHDFDVQVNP